MQQEMEYIYEVYKEKNFTRAAEKLYITQPALSMAIQKVEDRLGMPIFDRSSRPITLTEAGEAYLEHIREVRQLETEFEQHIQDIRDLNTGVITMGGSHYLNAYILPSILAGFESRYPNVNVVLNEASSAELSEQLRKQEIDLTFHCSPEFIQDFKRYPAFCDHILLAVPKNIDCCTDSEAVLTVEQVMNGRHLREDCPSVRLSEFSELPFILLAKGNNLYERSIRMFREAGFEPRTKMVLSQLVTAYHMADAGIGATFVSDRLLLTPTSGLNYYRIKSGITTRQFYILLPKRKYVSAAVRRFIEYFGETAGGCS
ncbi:MAG TPA: hypothetical protein DCG37_05235 [Lachnospiraceae bacterium]|nr:hypothetical protein [Lachnospiraceae bacterium]